MKRDENYPIDIVVPWVDGSDPAWIKEKKIKENELKITSVSDTSDVRFRDWDIIKYFFRSIDQYAPWVNMIHFVTWGHLPKWLNPDAPKLHIVNHKDFIPEEYLPTFSSHTIDLNIHRIPSLSEHFVYFNDDVIILQPTKRTDFFKNGLPRDYAILNVISSSHRGSVMDTALTDIEVINDYFPKNKTIKKNLWKWFNPIYGKEQLRTILLMPWPKFITLHGTHVCNSFLKSTFTEVWDTEYELLDSTCRHAFRTRRDANQWLIREWQICKGLFWPISPQNGRAFPIRNNNEALKKALMNHSPKVICINDSGIELLINEEIVREEINMMLEQAFPMKSSFEK